MSFLAALLVLFLAESARAQSDTCAAAPEIESGRFEGTTAGMSSDGATNCGNSADSPDVWFRITPETNCSLLADACESEFDTVLSVHSGCPGTTANSLSCNDDACEVQSRISLDATAGETYLIRLSGYGGTTGNYVLEIECEEIVVGQPGDTCEDAVDAEPGRYSGDTRGFASDGSANCGSSRDSPDFWFRYTAQEDCFVVASTCGSAFDTVLSVHSGCPGSSANQITCNDDACGVQSRIGFDAQTGQSYWIRVSGYSGASGTFKLELTCRDLEGEGPDLKIADVEDLRQMGRVGSVAALSAQSVVCNVGSMPVTWLGVPENQHPFFVLNAYRSMDDRFEQIGQSWAKHGFAVSQDDLCNLACIPLDPFSLGLGCADIYDADTNADRFNMGPRTEINPRTGAFAYQGSYLEQNQGRVYDPIQLRLQVSDDDLNPAAHPGASYYLELYALGRDDADRTNSVGWKPFSVSGAPGGIWNLSLRGAAASLGPAAEAWEGATRTTIPEELGDDGRCYLYARVTDNGDGSWRYEYALYNLDLDRGVRGFSIPVAPWTSVRDIGFHAVLSHDDDFSNEPWAAARGDDRLTWISESAGDDPGLNPLIWGTMYNFRFAADAGPAPSTATLALFKDEAAELSGPTVGPSTGPRFRRGDADASGRMEITDAILVLNFLFTGGVAPACPDAADMDDSGDLNVSDPIYGLSWLFRGGEDLPAPGPDTCGSDLTSEEPPLPECAYDASNC